MPAGKLSLNGLAIMLPSESELLSPIDAAMGCISALDSEGECWPLLELLMWPPMAARALPFRASPGGAPEAEMVIVLQLASVVLLFLSASGIDMMLSLMDISLLRR